MPVGMDSTTKDSTESTGLTKTPKYSKGCARYNSNGKDNSVFSQDLGFANRDDYSVCIGVEQTKIGQENSNVAVVSEQKTPGKQFKIKAFFKNAPRRKLLVLFFCTLANFLSSCGFALIAPFFPLVAKKKGMDLTTVGVVFSVYQLVGFLASPIIGNFLNRIGTKFVYLSGLFICATATICFGVLDKGPGGTVFIVMCIVCRSVEALGMAGFTTSGITIVSSEFPDNIGTVTSIFNAGSALGLVTGPVVGGALYDLGGYGLPFFVIAGLSILDAVVIYFFLPPLQVVEHKRDKSILALLPNLKMLVPMMCVGVGVGGIAIYDAVFATHVEPFKLSASMVGMFYLVAAGMYTVTSPIWGYTADATSLKEPLVMFAMAVFGLGFLICGPSPLLPFIPFKVWSVGLGFFLIGASIGGITIPSIACMMQAANDMGYEKNVDTNALVSGLYLSAYSLGGFMGPMAGSAIVQHYGFPKAFTSFGLTSFTVMFIFLGFFCIRRQCDSQGKQKYENR